MVSEQIHMVKGKRTRLYLQKPQPQLKCEVLKRQREIIIISFKYFQVAPDVGQNGSPFFNFINQPR